MLVLLPIILLSFPSKSDNNSIIIGRAVWIAVNRLGGTDPDEIQKLILQSRGVGY